MFTPPKINTFTSTIVSLVDLTPLVREFTLSVPESFDFAPGQFVTVLFKAQERTFRRSYSLSSAPPARGVVSLIIRKVEDGPGSEYMFSRGVGDTITVLGPFGVFVVHPDQQDKPLVFIGTGTGIGPFRSMIHHLLSTGFSHPITLIAGYRHHALYDEEFLALAKKHSNFSYKVVLSQPPSSYSGDVGHVQVCVRKYIADGYDAQFYICGLYKMIEETARLLLDKKIARPQIHFERYD